MSDCQHCGGRLTRLELGSPTTVQWFCSRCLKISEPTGPLAGLRKTLNVLEYKPVPAPPGLVIESELLKEMPSSLCKRLWTQYEKLESGIFTHTLTPEPERGFHIGGGAPSVPMENYKIVAWDMEFGDTDMGVDLEQPQKDEVPVIEGSVIGFRAWRLNGRSWRLQGTGAGHGGDDWVPGVNEAHCGPRGGTNNEAAEFHIKLMALARGKHKAPGAYCHCGLNGLARFQDEASWYKIADTNDWRHVVGAFEAWSDESEDQRFFIHSTGFRAQYGQIVLLAVEDDCPQTKRSAIKALAADYGADMCKLSHLEDAAKEHGQLVPDHMLVWAAQQEVRRLIPAISPSPMPFGHAAASAREYTETFGASTKMLREALFGSQLSVEQTTKNFNELGKVLGQKPPAKPRKGIKQRLKTSGPPFHGKWKKGDVVQDRKQRLYECVAAGSPGSWSLVTG